MSKESSTPPVLTIEGPRATIRFNRPKAMNRIEPDDLFVLMEAFDRVEADPVVRVLVLTGTGRAFSAGFDLRAVGAHSPDPSDAPRRADVSFETVAAHIDPGPHLGRHPLFQVALSLDVFTDSHFDLGATHVDITPRPLDIAKCDLHFHLVERRDAVGRTIGMDVGIVYPTALFDRGTVQSLGELYEQILRRMITGPGEPWSTAASILQLV